MQVKKINIKKNLFLDISSGLCDHAGGLGLAVKPKKGRESNFKMKGVAKSERSEFHSVQAFHNQNRSLPHPISLPLSF